MENSWALQLAEFLRSVCWGLALGIVYAVFGVFRLRRRVWLMAVGDGLFWLLAGTGTFLFFLWVNGGILRGYLFCGMAVGFGAAALSVEAVKRLGGRWIGGMARIRRKKCG